MAIWITKGLFIFVICIAEWNVCSNLLNYTEGKINYISCNPIEQEYNYCIKLGKIVVCSLYLNNINTTKNWDSILTLPYTPIHPVILNTLWQISKNGMMIRYSTVSNETFQQVFTYICK